ncbi:MAG TPA: alanine racemase [Candidatus Omnitrophota bacterium]|nr:alanine racemase [Candidatus Omnitrophota bacterium]
MTESRVREEATWLELDKSALRHNLAQLIALTLPSATIMAVVKANAYGHGLIPIAQSLREQVSHFGVASLEEALTLRRHEMDTPILLFGVLFGEAIEAAIEAHISLAVSSVEQAREISERARKLRKPAAIHIKVDTGMGRLGIPKAQAVRAIGEITSLQMLHLEGLFTHFPQGEVENDPFTKEQVHSFLDVIEKISKKGIHVPCRHAANSLGIVNFKDAHLNLVRPGLTLYGIHPSASIKPKLTLKPVLNWRARLILVKKINAGESVGYGRTFVAHEPTVIGVLPVGYSHGYPFSLSGQGSVVLFQGKRFPVVGRVSMDYLTVNFGPDFSGVKVGEVVTLLGRDGAEAVTAESLAEKAGTIPYEIVTRLSPALPRILL